MNWIEIEQWADGTWNMEQTRLLGCGCCYWSDIWYFSHGRNSRDPWLNSTSDIFPHTLAHSQWSKWKFYLFFGWRKSAAFTIQIEEGFTVDAESILTEHRWTAVVWKYSINEQRVDSVIEKIHKFHMLNLPSTHNGMKIKNARSC